VLWVFLG
jgi:hypothetical protein